MSRSVINLTQDLVKNSTFIYFFVIIRVLQHLPRIIARCAEIVLKWLNRINNYAIWKPIFKRVNS